jgi:ATPase subunit of ABC transporter with duplicated ATPase domains
MDVQTTVIAGLWGLWATYSKPIQEAVFKKLSESANHKAKEAAQVAWQRVNWNLSANKYQQRLQEMYGAIRILGKPEPVSLEGIFTDVLILETPTAFHRYDIKLLRHQPEHLEKKKARKSGLGLVKDMSNRRIFILGKPGAGKTTFLKYLTVQAAKGEIDKIPIFVSLKEWADSQLELMEFLVRQFDICDFPDPRPFVEHILRKGNVLASAVRRLGRSQSRRKPAREDD